MFVGLPSYASQKKEVLSDSPSKNESSPSVDFWDSFELVSDESLEVDDLQVIAALKAGDDVGVNKNASETSSVANIHQPKESVTGVSGAEKRGK